MEVLLDIQKAIKGDKDAFNRIIAEYEKKLYIIAKSRISSDEDIKDIIQETIMKAYINIHKLKDANKFNPWITTILINVCNVYYRKNKINLVSYDDIQENHAALSNVSDIEDLNNEMNFLDIIRDLDIEDRTIITMYYMQEYTTKDISKILKINESTLRTRISKIRNLIKNTLTERRK